MITVTETDIPKKYYVEFAVACWTCDRAKGVLGSYRKKADAIEVAEEHEKKNKGHNITVKNGITKFHEDWAKAE